MPTYEYECLKCRDIFEVFQNMSDKVLENCPKCGSKVKRLIGCGSGIIFKGPGFYATDYRSRKPKDSAKSDPASTCPAAKNNTCKGCA
jgi:putative FmdB family regulatory protein